MTVPFGIGLSLLFGVIGLVIFSALNLLICYYCPDTYLFQKAPSTVLRISKKQIYKLSDMFLVVLGVGIFLVPLISIGLIWVFTIQGISAFVLEWGRLEIINEHVKLTATYMIDGSLFDKNIDDDTIRKLEIMRQERSWFATYTMISRIMAYILLPIYIVITTFERTRAARSSYQFAQSRQQHILKRLFTFMVIATLFALLDYYYSAPYRMTNLGRLEDVGLDFKIPFLGLYAAVIPIFWLLLISMIDQLIARPRTDNIKHPSTYELYLQSKGTL